MEKGKPSVNYKECMACGICAAACPFDCLSLSRNGIDKYKKQYPELADKQMCTGCALCEKACPVEAIKLVP